MPDSDSYCRDALLGSNTAYDDQERNKNGSSGHAMETAPSFDELDSSVQEQLDLKTFQVCYNLFGSVK